MHHVRATGGAVVLVAAMALAPHVARADTKGTTAEAAAQDEATKLFRKGNAAFEQKRWAEAEAAYREAWKLARTFDVAANLGEVSLHLGKPREAARYLAFSLRAAPPSAKAAQRERTRSFLDEAKKQVGIVRLRANVADVRATIDGAVVDADELAHEVFVDPGAHVIIAQREGYQEARLSVRVVADSAEEVKLSLVPMPPPQRSVMPGVILGSVAGAALVTGIGLFAGGRGKASSASTLHDAILKGGVGCVGAASQQDPRCGELLDTTTAGNTLQKAGVGMMIGAGAAAVATVIYFVLPPPRREAATGTTVRFTPDLQPTSAGLVVSGTF